MGEEIAGRSDSPSDETARTLTENGTDSSVLGEVPIEAATQSADGHNYSYWPSVRFDVAPHTTYHFSQQFRGSTASNNFLKDVMISYHFFFHQIIMMGVMHLLMLQLLVQGFVLFSADSYGASMIMDEGEPMCDFCWYSYMASSDPVSCVFSTTTCDHPVHLWDATSGWFSWVNILHENIAHTVLMMLWTRLLLPFRLLLILLEPSKQKILPKIDDIPHCASQVQFSNEGNYLYTGGRKVNFAAFIICWFHVQCPF
ncbi:hypothetical protein LINPERHAP1_LOCUS25295 [Linum perenne]